MFNTIRSVVLGHAVGDALGVPVEFNKRESLDKNPVTDMQGFGTYNVPAGSWSDDTSMSLCALESLAKGNVDYDDVMRNFCEWYYAAKFTPTGTVFDIGNTCYDAIYNYTNLNYPALKCGRADISSNGNGSLMRIHPFVLYAYYNGIQNDNNLIEIIKNASSLTHAHQCSIDGCIIYACVLYRLLSNPSKNSIYEGLEMARSMVGSHNTYYNRLLNKNIGLENKESIMSSGYIVDSLEAAIWCILITNNYSDCVLQAVNLGNDTDTIAAIAGGLAGALYGINSIPKNWLDTLKQKEYIEEMCRDAYETWRKNEI
jgi:ADP-ribosylglycohydrolase